MKIKDGFVLRQVADTWVVMPLGQQSLDFDGMLLHAAAVVVDGKAYLFTAPRKTGKSTHVQLWLQEFEGRATILNDDNLNTVCIAYGEINFL